MKRKVLLTILCLAISVSIVACGTENTAEQQEVIATEQQEAMATEQTAETEIIEERQEKEDKSDNGIPESEDWTDYKKTMDYYVGEDLISTTLAKLLNPDAYGHELAGQASMETFMGTESPDLGVYVKQVKTTTTKGYKIIAEWYTETNTVQYIYCDEAVPGGMWYVDWRLWTI